MTLSNGEIEKVLEIIKDRFEANMYRHTEINWQDVEDKLRSNPEKTESLSKMEEIGGEPDIVTLDDNIIFYDTSVESPKGRRSLCYDKRALEERKKNKPAGSAINMAENMKVEILTPEQYFNLQRIFNFDTKTSSWVKTPDNIREKGGAIFCDYRYGTVFTYHNGADSYYSSRGFRASLKL